MYNMALIGKHNTKFSRFAALQTLSQRNGLRCMIFIPQTKIYKGEWADDKQNGMGRMLYTGKNKTLYEGEWKLNKRNGWGRTSQWDNMLDNFKITYTGEWVNGIKNGFGYLHKSNGAYYEGFLKDNKRHGYGRCFYADGSFYQGDWKLDKFDGHGIFLHFDGSSYEGFWKNGEKCGWGTYFHKRSGQLQEGFWHKNVPIRSTLKDLLYRETDALFPSPLLIPKLYLKPDIPWLSELNEKRTKTYPDLME